MQEAARAFTGWSYRRQTGQFVLTPSLHDAGAKTVLGQTGNLGGEDIIRMAVAQPAGAPYVVSKLWSGFTRPVGPSDAIVRQLAPAFAKDLDVGKLMRSIFLHPEFQAPATRTGLVKQPIEYVVGALRAVNLRATIAGANLPQTLEALGQ